LGLCRVKETLILTSQGWKEFDSADPINANGLADELVRPASSEHVLCRVRFYDVVGQRSLASS